MQVVQVVEIPFHGDIIEGALINGRPMVSIKRLCENVEIDANGLKQRLDREGVVSTCMIHVNDSLGRPRPIPFIDLKDIAYVVTTIDVSRCKNREQLVKKVSARRGRSIVCARLTVSVMDTVDAKGELRPTCFIDMKDIASKALLPGRTTTALSLPGRPPRSCARPLSQREIGDGI